MKNYVSMLLCCILTIVCSRSFSQDTLYSQLFEAYLVPAPLLVGEMNPQASLFNYDTHISKLSSAKNGISGFEKELSCQKYLSRG